jgi:UDP-GlcNAc:undecaprenyl-phosphate GlcNAc-1-phosphate transferase
VRKLGSRAGFVAHPSADRYAQRAVPLGGGIAIFATMAGAMLAAMGVVRLLLAPGYMTWLGESVTVHAPGFLDRIGQLVVVLLCVSVLFAMGLWDDKRHLGPFFKLAVQFVIALAAAYLADIRVELFVKSRLITSVLSAFWIVLVINAFNFLDNMDGLAAGIAVIATSILFAAGALSAALSAEDFQVFVGGLSLLLIGTLLGFLVFNFPPARIFMGDAGSLVVGFFVALLTLKTTYYYEDAQSGRWYAIFLPALVMAVPLYDFVSVTLLRISQGKSPFVGDTQHFSHRLKRHGLSDRQVVLTLYLATLCTGLGATFLYQVKPAGAILIFMQTIMILAIIAVFETTIKNDKSSS